MERIKSTNKQTTTSVIPGFVVYLIKDSALNDLFGKTLGILSFYFGCYSVLITLPVIFERKM